MTSEDVAKQLKAVIDECARLKEENRRLKLRLGIPEEKPNVSYKDRISLKA